MQRNDRWPTDYEPDPRSRRNSTSSRGSKKGKKSPPSSVASAASTPKRLVKQPEFVVTGKQILKRPDRANSLPASRRRPSLEAAKPQSAPPRRPDVSQSSKSRDTSLEDDASLELSQVSDFENMNSKYGIRRCPPATSTPKKRASLPTTNLKTRDSSHSSKTEVTYRHGMSTDLDYSSVSPEYSGPSSTEASPRQTKGISQDMSSCCVSSWMESDSETKMERGEWSRFWANYNGSTAPASSYYDQCPTPRGDIGLADLDFSADFSSKHSPDVKTINSIIRNEGLHLTPRETENIIKCAHILGNVLTKAIERRSKEKENTTDKIQEMAEVDIKKRTTSKEKVTTDKIQVLAEKEEKDSKKKIVFTEKVHDTETQVLAEEKELKKKTSSKEKEVNQGLAEKEGKDLKKKTLSAEKGHDTETQVLAEERDLKKKTTSKEKEVNQELAEKEGKDLKKKTLSAEKEHDTDNTRSLAEIEDEKNKVSETEQELAEKGDGKDLKKKTLTLNLKEMNVPLETKEEKRCETVTTQTDISLPNTKSAPKIFENILRQLSRSSIDEGVVKKVKDSLDVEVKVETKE